MQWRVEVLDKTVQAEIEAWPVEVRAALTKIVERIVAVGLAAGQEGRALYVTASGRRVVIVAAFMEKTQKTPRHIIEMALERAKGV